MQGASYGVTGMGDLFPVHPAYRAILPVLWRHPKEALRLVQGVARGPGALCHPDQVQQIAMFPGRSISPFACGTPA